MTSRRTDLKQIWSPASWVDEREVSKINLHLNNLNLVESESSRDMPFIIRLPVAVPVIVIDPAPPFHMHAHSHTCTLSHTRRFLSLLTPRSYQHTVQIKSCALNLIKPLIYIKQAVSPSSLVCISQDALLPQEGDLTAPTLHPGLSSHTPTILIFLLYIR